MIRSFGFFFPGIRKSMLIPSLSCDTLQWRVLAKILIFFQKYLIWHPSFLEFSKQWKFSKWKISAIFDWIDFKSLQSLQFNIVYSLQLLRSSRLLLRSSRSELSPDCQFGDVRRSNFGDLHWSSAQARSSNQYCKIEPVFYLPGIDLTVTIFSNIKACKL